VQRDEQTTQRARDLRRQSSLAEQKAWELLRNRKISGVKFRRQYPIGPYFADFACLSRKLVIEIDGDHHDFQIDADARRTRALEREGWRVIRFPAREVVANPEGIWAEIELVLTPPHLTSPPKGQGNRMKIVCKLLPNKEILILGVSPI
jgi:very-short-patch-repair endonuclease